MGLCHPSNQPIPNRSHLLTGVDGLKFQLVVVDVVESLIILKEELLLEGLTLAIFFVDFRRPIKIVTFPQKNGDPKTGC